MTHEYKKKLEDLGVNVTDALDRFMDNESFYQKCLSKFPQDPNFELLESNIQKGDFPQAFKYAHTLKGLAATLELESLLEILIPMTDHLRKNEGAGIQEDFELLRDRYEALCHFIKEE